MKILIPNVPIKELERDEYFIITYSIIPKLLSIIIFKG